jgi:ketol-acid reductoisomerase
MIRKLCVSGFNRVNRVNRINRINRMLSNISFENTIYSNEYPIEKCKNILKNDIISVLGYGPQGKAQSLILRDLDYPVILGLRDNGKSWDNAIEDGWIPNKNLFEIKDACEQGTIIKYLLSDSAQKTQWSIVNHFLTKNKTLYFSHGFSLHFNEYTNVTPPKDVNVIMIAPKCSGKTVRSHFLNGKTINSSYAIHQDVNNAYDKCMALGFSMGNKLMFETSIENEVLSDLTGERCILMGMIQAAFSAQYKVLRENNHGPIESYNETVEEALDSLYPIIKEKGMDWLYENCSKTAQVGAIHWSKKFERQLKPMIEECYNSVKDGSEVESIINLDEHKLQEDLNKIKNQELWKVHREMNKIKNSPGSWNGFLL